MTVQPLSGMIGIRAIDLRDHDERRRIERLIADHPDATPFHLPAWSLAVANGCRQTPHTLIAERADGALAGFVPLTEVRSALFGRALVSNGFAVGGGILAAEATTAGALAQEAWALARRLGCATLELRGGALPQGEPWQIDHGSYLGFARAIAADDAAELLAIPRKQRAEVRKALAADLRITIGRDAADAKVHHAVYAESVRNLGTPVFPARLFRAMLREFGDAADILTVRSGGVAVASVLSLYFKGTVYPYWGGGTQVARGLRGNDAMYFALMRHARERGCTRFDFGRSKVGTGPAAFKKNWGFEGVALTYAKCMAAGETPRDINPLNPRYARKIALWKRLPTAFANRIGPWIARGLG